MYSAIVVLGQTVLTRSFYSWELKAVTDYKYITKSITWNKRKKRKRINNGFCTSVDSLEMAVFLAT